MTREVPRDEWLAAGTALVADGHTYLDLLTAVDRGEELEVVAHLVNPGTLGRVMIATRMPAGDPHVATLTALLPAASWHERETAEMFGIAFDGHPDPRPLLLRTTLGRPPLRSSTVLAARAITPWPAAADPQSGGRGSRRRQLPPGVPDGWLHEAPP
jgi:NADH-quinone oxidoreductase subunit C